MNVSEVCIIGSKREDGTTCLHKSNILGTKPFLYDSDSAFKIAKRMRGYPLPSDARGARNGWRVYKAKLEVGEELKE